LAPQEGHVGLEDLVVLLHKEGLKTVQAFLENELLGERQLGEVDGGFADEGPKSGRD
jgi:hypothetical protein